MGNDPEDRTLAAVSVDTEELLSLVSELEAALRNTQIYRTLLGTATRMNREAFGRDILNGWDEALLGARQGIVNLRLICAELVRREKSVLMLSLVP